MLQVAILRDDLILVVAEATPERVAKFAERITPQLDTLGVKVVVFGAEEVFPIVDLRDGSPAVNEAVQTVMDWWEQNRA